MFRKQRKQQEVEEKPSQPVQIVPAPINRQPRATEPIELTSEESEKISDEIMQEFANDDEKDETQRAKRQIAGKYGGTKLDAPSSYRQEKQDPRKYTAYDMATSPKWIDIQFANGRRVLLSHFDIKRVDSMTPEALSILCSNCIIKLKGKRLHDLIQPFEKIHRLRAFDDKKFDAPSDNEPIIELIELKEME